MGNLFSCSCQIKKTQKFQKSQMLSLAQAENPYNIERNKKISQLPEDVIEIISELLLQTHWKAEEIVEAKLNEFFSQREFEYFEKPPPRLKNKEISLLKKEVFSYVLYRLSYFFKHWQENFHHLQILISFLRDITKIEEKFKTNLQDPKIYELDLDFHLSLLYLNSLAFLDSNIKIGRILLFVPMIQLPTPYNAINQTPDDKILTETWPIFQDIINSYAFQKALFLLNFCVTKRTVIENDLLHEINQLTLDKIFWIFSGKLAGITTFQGRIGLCQQDIRHFYQDEKVPHLLFTLINLLGNYIVDFLVERGAGTPYLERNIAEANDKLKEFSHKEQEILKEIGGREGGFALQYFLFGDTKRCYYQTLFKDIEKIFQERFLSKENYKKWPLYSREELAEMGVIEQSILRSGILPSYWPQGWFL